MPELLKRTARGVAIGALRRNEADAAAEVMARSFAGSGTVIGEPCFEWAFGATSGDPSGGEYEETRLTAMRWYLKWAFLICERHGVVAGAKDATTGRLLGVLCALPPAQLHRTTTSPLLRPHVLRTAMLIGGPPPSKPAGSATRMDEVGKLMHMVRKRGAKKGKPTWLVWILAVDANAQGAGVGGALLDAFHWLVDAASEDAWLETNGDRNVAFYTKQGYSTAVPSTPLSAALGKRKASRLAPRAAGTGACTTTGEREVPPQGDYPGEAPPEAELRLSGMRRTHGPRAESTS